jgi:hypothetical protein
MYVSDKVQVTWSWSWLLELWSLLLHFEDNGYKWWLRVGPLMASRKYRDG